MRKFAIIGVMSLLATSQALAAADSGNEWREYCTSKKDASRAACFSYARGMADALQVWQNLEPERAAACIPVKVDAGQLADVALKYMREHPERRHMSAGWLLAAAFMEAWPCSGATN